MQDLTVISGMTVQPCLDDTAMQGRKIDENVVDIATLKTTVKVIGTTVKVMATNYEKMEGRVMSLEVSQGDTVAASCLAGAPLVSH